MLRQTFGCSRWGSGRVLWPDMVGWICCRRCLLAQPARIAFGSLAFGASCQVVLTGWYPRRLPLWSFSRAHAARGTARRRSGSGGWAHPRTTPPFPTRFRSGIGPSRRGRETRSRRSCATRWGDVAAGHEPHPDRARLLSELGFEMPGPWYRARRSSRFLGPTFRSSHDDRRRQQSVDSSALRRAST